MNHTLLALAAPSALSIARRLVAEALRAEEGAWLDRLAGKAALADAHEAHADALWDHAEAWMETARRTAEAAAERELGADPGFNDWCESRRVAAMEEQLAPVVANDAPAAVAPARAA